MMYEVPERAYEKQSTANKFHGKQDLVFEAENPTDLMINEMWLI